MIIKGIFPILLCLFVVSCTSKTKSEDFQSELNKYIESLDAKIGVAVIINDMDTIEVNGNESFPMFSVYKFPIALAVADHCTNTGMKFDSKLTITQSDLKKDTYSPMTDRYSDIDSLSITIRELLAYALQLSDNNASDILLKLSGGPDSVNKYIENTGITDIYVSNTEAEMYEDNNLALKNSSTPLAMAILMNRFDREFNDPLSIEIKSIMENCSTGTDRLSSPLMPGNDVIGHKTGTGFISPDGRLMAINDCGYIHLADGQNYSISVFIADSGYDAATTSKIIAEISEKVLHYVTHVK